MFVINQMREKSSEFISTTIPNQYAKANRFSKICMVISGLSAVEMAICTVGNVFSILRNGGTEALNYNFSANLGSTIFYGISALNPIPGSASIASMIFSVYSYMRVDSTQIYNKGYQTYLTSEIIGRSIKCFGAMVGDFFSEFLVPVANKISTIVEPIFRFIYEYTAKIANGFIELVSHLNLPKHPIWLPVGCLITAIFIYKVVYPSIKAFLVQSKDTPGETRL